MKMLFTFYIEQLILQNCCFSALPPCRVIVVLKVMQLSIVSPAPLTTRAIAGIQWGLTRGFTEYCVPADPGPTPGLCGEIFLSKGLVVEIYYPGMSTYAGTLTKDARGYGAGTYPGIYKKNVPRSPGQYPGLYLGHHKVQNLIPRQVPTIPGQWGPGLQLITA